MSTILYNMLQYCSVLYNMKFLIVMHWFSDACKGTRMWAQSEFTWMYMHVHECTWMYMNVHECIYCTQIYINVHYYVFMYINVSIYIKDTLMYIIPPRYRCCHVPNRSPTSWRWQPSSSAAGGVLRCHPRWPAAGV